MKKLLLAAFGLFGAFVINAQDLKPDAVVKLSQERHDFGKIKQGVPVTTFFELTNISDKPIILESVTASCGCTTPEYSKEPIMAGATTKIKVGYNAAAPAHFEKDVFIKIAGVSDMKIIKISGDVVEASTASAPVIVNQNNTAVTKTAAAKPAAKKSAAKKTVAYKKS